MRLWHIDLIRVLPKAQLVAQWRECSAIAGNIQTKGSPNHILVNKIMNYPIVQFVGYSLFVRAEMTRRGYKTMQSVEDKICGLLPHGVSKPDITNFEQEDIFSGWHNARYFQQCFYNLQEKYDCGGISEKEWLRVLERCEEL